MENCSELSRAWWHTSNLPHLSLAWYQNRNQTSSHHPHLSQLKIQHTFTETPFSPQNSMYLHNTKSQRLWKQWKPPKKCGNVPAEKCSQRSLLVKSMRPFKAFTAWSVSLVILALDSWKTWWEKNWPLGKMRWVWFVHLSLMFFYSMVNLMSRCSGKSHWKRGTRKAYKMSTMLLGLWWSGWINQLHIWWKDIEVSNMWNHCQPVIFT